MGKKNWFDLFENKRNESADGNLRFYLAQILFAINFDEEGRSGQLSGVGDGVGGISSG
jgi:hypothetical protein